MAMFPRLALLRLAETAIMEATSEFFEEPEPWLTLSTLRTLIVTLVLGLVFVSVILRSRDKAMRNGTSKPSA